MIKSGALLYIGKDPVLAEFAKAVASLCLLKPQIEQTAKAGVAFIDQKQPDVILVSSETDKEFKEFENEVQSQIGLYSIKINPNTIFYFSKNDLSDLVALVTSPIFGNIVYPQLNELEKSAHHFSRLIKFVLHERAFGLEVFFGDQVKIQSIQLTNSSQKIRAVESVRKLLAAVGFKSRSATVIANAVDELLMNAIFDAPVDDLGKALFDKTNRNLELNLDEKNQITLKIGYDGSYVGVSIIDQYGSLDKSKLISHISKKYKDEDYQVREARAGAGIGLGTVYRLGGAILFSSEVQIKTEVTVFFKNLGSYAEFKNQFKFFSNQFYF